MGQDFPTDPINLVLLKKTIFTKDRKDKNKGTKIKNNIQMQSFLFQLFESDSSEIEYYID